MLHVMDALSPIISKKTLQKEYIKNKMYSTATLKFHEFKENKKIFPT